MKKVFCLVLGLVSISAMASAPEAMTPANASQTMLELENMGVKNAETDGVDYYITDVDCHLNMMAGPAKPTGTPGSIRMERSFTCNFRDNANGSAQDTVSGTGPAELADAIYQTLSRTNGLAQMEVKATSVKCTQTLEPMEAPSCTVVGAGL